MLHREEEPVFILGRARSGTTLLQRILNSHRGSLIWGEHDGFLKGVAEAYFVFLESKLVAANIFNQPRGIGCSVAQLKNPAVWPGWANGYGETDMKKHFRRLIENFFNPLYSFPSRKRRWGFKEVRYGFGDRVLEMLSDLYPKARFIFVVRHPVEVTVSAQAAFGIQDHEKIVSAWLQQNRFFLDFVGQKKSQCCILKFEEMVHPSGKALKDLFDRLHFPFDAEKIKAIVEMEEGRNPASDGARSKEDSLTPSEKKRVMEIASPVSALLGYKNANG